MNMRNWIKSFFLIAIFVMILKAQIWTNNGPFGGYTTTITVDPMDTNIVYVGTREAGIFRSLDGGKSWSPINNGLPTKIDTVVNLPPSSSWWFGYYYPITLIRINPQDPSEIFVGTSGKGLFYSNNYGNNWQERNNGLPNSSAIRELWINPIDPKNMFCGMNGLYRSSNGGLSWTLVDSVPSGDYWITTISNEPGNPSTIYVGFSSHGQPEISWGLLKSTDNGNNWQALVQNTVSFYNLYVDPDSINNLWSIVYTNFLDWMLAYSKDGGYNWVSYFGLIRNPWYEVMFLYADVNFNLYIANGYQPSRIYKSTDHGRTWSFINQIFPFQFGPGSGPKMTVNPLNTNVLYFATELGVFSSNDGGYTAHLKENGMINSYISDVEVNPKDPSILYAGGQYGLWKSVDGGESWFRLGTYSVTSLAIDPQYPDTVYWGGNGLMRSYDGGNTWEDIGGKFIGTITAIEVHPDSTNILFVGVYPSRLYKSSDWGNNWSLSYSPPHGSFWIEDIAIDPSNTQIIYFGAINNSLVKGFYKSIDGGISWSRMSNLDEVKSIAIHPYNSDTIYVTTKNKIMVSFNGGFSFHEIGQEITSKFMSKIIIDSFNPMNLFAGTKDKGVFYTTNSGQTWHSLPGYYNLRITDMYYLPRDNQIFLATNGAGCWRGDNIVLKLKQSNEYKFPLSQTIHLLPAYPNPFNSTCSIRFELPKAESVRLEIYNVRGKRVRLILKGKKPAGRYSYVWNGRSDDNRQLPSGVYFVVLQTNHFQKVQKLLLIK